MPKVESRKPVEVLRRVSHEERIRIGREICNKIIEAYGEAVLAICVYASTAKGLDRPYSDLEMLCVVRDGYDIPNKYYVYDGLLVEIDYFQESTELKEAKTVTTEWPLAADSFRNRLVLFERDHWLKKLEEAVAESDKKDFSEQVRKAMLMVTESLAAARNAGIKGEAEDLRTRAVYLAYNVAKLVLLFNQKYILTTSWLWKTLFDCKEQPEGLREQIDIAAGFKPSSEEEVMNACEKLWQGSMLIVQKRHISIESDELKV